MNKNADLFPVYEFRPIWASGQQILRYAEGAWIPDDGEYDLAFLQKRLCLYLSLPYYENLTWKWYSKHWSSCEPLHPRGNAWHYMTRDGSTSSGSIWKARDFHPNHVAGEAGMSHACDRYRSASGMHVELDVRDRHIRAGLVRDQATKEVLTIPALQCRYCGDNAEALLAELATRDKGE